MSGSGSFSGSTPTRQQMAMAMFRQRGQAASDAGFVGGFPNFYEAHRALQHFGGTIFLKADVAEWRDVPLSALGNPPLENFEERMRRTQAYASDNGFVGGFPNFFHADYGSGVVCGTILLKAGGAEWRDVALSDLNNPSLDDFELRFRSTQDYAKKHGFEGGFPNLFHAEVPRTHFTVCGTILLKPGSAEWHDVLVYTDPR